MITVNQSTFEASNGNIAAVTVALLAPALIRAWTCRITWALYAVHRRMRVRHENVS